MFKEARIKLTAWYLAIIMVISLSFSVVIFLGINRELTRIESLQSMRAQRNQVLATLLEEIGEERIARGLPPPNLPLPNDIENVSAIRTRIITILGFINLSILVLAGAGGYFLAGRTLEPIRKNMEDQRAFISDASHELRTPLTSLRTEIEVALRDKSRTLADSTNLIKSNLDDVNRMQKLANYLLEMNRYDGGNGMKKTKVDLKKVAIRAIGKMKVKADLTRSIVLGNEDSLVELMTILLDNAFKYGRGKEVEVRTKKGGVLEVTDHGAGIASMDLPHIFDRFYRSDKSRGTEGYGLGLSIAKSIVDLHGGKIEVTSKPGKGTKFRITL